MFQSLDSLLLLYPVHVHLNETPVNFHFPDSLGWATTRLRTNLRNVTRGHGHPLGDSGGGQIGVPGFDVWDVERGCHDTYDTSTRF